MTGKDHGETAIADTESTVPSRPSDYADTAKAIEAEIGKVIVGQHRPRAVGADLPALRGPRPARRRARPRQDACCSRRWPTRSTSSSPGIQFTPDLMPADIVGTQVLEEDDDGRRALPLPGRARLRQPRAGRRDQPGHAQDPVGAARGHAGAHGHRGRRDPTAAPTVPRHGDAEPARDGGHLPAARGPARPVPAQGARPVPRRPTSWWRSSTGRPATSPPTSSRWPTPSG